MVCHGGRRKGFKLGRKEGSESRKEGSRRRKGIKKRGGARKSRKVKRAVCAVMDCHG